MIGSVATMITILLILIRTVEFEILGWTLFSKFWHVISFRLNRVNHIVFFIRNIFFKPLIYLNGIGIVDKSCMYVHDKMR